MRRGHNGDGLGERVIRVGGVLLMASAGALLLTQLPALRRYLGMRRMSAERHPRPPGTQTEATEAPPRWGTSHWPVH